MTLRQAARAVTALYEQALADSGIRATQYTALQVLKLAPKLTATELANAIGIDQTTATRTLALLRKGGLATDWVSALPRNARPQASRSGKRATADADDYMSSACATSTVPPAERMGQPLAFLWASSRLAASIKL